MNLWSILGIAEFEFRRSLTLGRLAGAAGLVLFPPCLLGLMRIQANAAIPDEFLGLLMSFLIIQVSCGMSLLLTTTPLVNAELEGQTWSYLSSRPGGRIANLMGKLLLAIVVTIVLGILATTLSMTVTMVRQPFRLWLSLVALVCLCSVCYASIFAMIGVWMQRRAMAIAVIYMLLVEGILGSIPATANRFTISYRARSLLVDWMNWDRFPNEMRRLFGEDAIGWHLLSMLGLFLFAMSAAAGRIRWGEYPTHVED